MSTNENPITSVLQGRLLVVVLGMHRSGTSALAEALHALGLWAGPVAELLGATEENARGYWELRDLVNLNDEILAAINARWDSPQIPPPVLLDPQRHAALAQRAQQFLRKNFGDEQSLVLKDPRMCRLLGFWLPQFDAAGLRTRFVIALRHPEECALSLHRRDRLPLPVGHWLWVDHMASAVNLTAGRERLFVAYERLLAQPRAELQRLARFVDVNAPVSHIDHIAATVVTPELRHQRRNPQEEATATTNEVPLAIAQRVFQALLPLAHDLSHDVPNTMDDWHQVHVEIKRLRSAGIEAMHDLSALADTAQPVKKTAIVLHLHYPEQWAEFVSMHERVSPEIDLFITVTEQQNPTCVRRIEHYDPKARVIVLPNRGRDIAPFLHVLPLLIEENYACACKVHTKRSAYADTDGLGWRLDLWTTLLGSAEEVERIRLRFACDTKLGMLGPARHWLSVQEFRDARHERVVELAQAVAPIAADADWHFFAGTMFWFRPQALQQIAAMKWSADAFEPEQGQREGTLAHSIERILPLAVRAAGYWVDLLPQTIVNSGGLPGAFIRSSTQQLLEELHKVRELLAATDAAQKEARELALVRLAHIDELQSALSHAQKLAWERESELEKLRRWAPVRLAKALRLLR